MSGSAVASTIPPDVPVPLDTFRQTIVGTPDEVWLLWLKHMHGRERHSLLGWRSLIQQHAAAPAA